MNDFRSKRGARTYQSSYRYYPKKSTLTGSSVPAPPLGPLIQTLSKYDLARDAKDHLDKASIQDCSLIASYNWLGKTDATIVIPGRPPRWTPLVGQAKLAEDSGVYYKDKNASRFPAHLMESTVLAALALNPGIPADIDIVACYSSLGNLIRFILGKDKSFRILVQAVGNAVFFVRRENSPTEKIEGIRGHGHTFPEAYTTWDPEVKGSDTHHRIIRYKFGGLAMLVRYEADGYVAEKGDSPPMFSSTSSSGKTSSSTMSEIADLSQLISGLNPVSSAPNKSSAKITIVKDSVPTVPQSQILELKTRGIWKKDKEDTVAEEMPKLWLAQIPNFVLAYHDQGKFEAGISVQNVKARVDRWEKTVSPELASFAALLHKIIGMVRARADKKLELCRTGVGRLEVREQLGDAGEMLSEETKIKWKDGGKGNDEPVGSLIEKDSLPESDDSSDSDDWPQEDEKDWAECSEACGYCGECKK